MDVVRTIDLTKLYDNRHIALSALNLRVERGSVFGLIGPNGAGKSTTFRILLGLHRPTAGTALVFGQPAHSERADIRRRIGFLPAAPRFPGHLTPISYLKLVGAVLGMPDDQAVIQIARLLKTVGLASVAPQRIAGFSNGMRTRLGLAAALMNDPELLILDEPTAGLDPLGRKLVAELVRGLAASGRTIIMATHVLDDVERVCTDIGIISQGHLTYSGPMREVRRLAGGGTITVEVGGDVRSFERNLHTLNGETDHVRYQRRGGEFMINFPAVEPLPERVRRILGLVACSGTELVRLTTRADDVETNILSRLGGDRLRSLSVRQSFSRALRQPAGG